MKNLCRLSGSKWKSFISTLFTKLAKDEILLYGEALTFNTLLAIIPLIGLIFSLTRAIVPEDTLVIKSFVFLAQLLPPEVAGFVSNKLSYFLERIKHFPLGKFSLLTYFLMSVGLLFFIESSLNKIFRSPKKRTLRERLSFFWFTLTIAPFLLLIPFIIHGYLAEKFKFSRYLILFFVVLIIYFIYQYFPLRKIPHRYALMSSLITGLLWIILSYLFSLYVKHAVSYSALYGSLSTLFFFFLWLFLNWTLFLLGAELTSVLSLKKNLDSPKLPCGWDKVILLKRSYERFRQGQPLNILELEEKLPLSSLRLYELISELEKKNLIQLADDFILPLKDFSKVSLAEVLEFPSGLEQEVQALFPVKIVLEGTKFEDLIHEDPGKGT